jgi:L-threonylcarbamoyladenylate synthase
METKLIDSPLEAAEILRSGGLVAFPTETVYGLGASVFDEDAVAKIFKAKQRPADNPLIAHVSSVGQIDELAEEITESAQALIGKFFPGPLTVVLKKKSTVPDIATAGLDSIGIRMPGSRLTQEFLKACDTSVAAPSANLSGRPSPTTWQAVYEDLNGRIDCILQGDATEIGLESTVVDCRGEVPIVLRQGAISVEQLRLVISKTELFANYSTAVQPSPGMRHRHYSPKARVVIVSKPDPSMATNRTAYIGTDFRDIGFEYGLTLRNAEEYAHELFEFFRECDRRGIETIYCQSVERTGVGAALMDRIERASDASEE